jgi:thiosulfate/3-mercaptopyruvate sulfurtransferase
MLRTRGITPDRTVITTCDTGLAATDAFFILRYLGFPDVRVHDEAWVGWSRSR